MTELEVVRNLAKEALSRSTPMSDHDDSLWDRNKRLVRNVELICRLPELERAGLQINRFCLMAATYFIDAGLAGCLSSGKIKAANGNNSRDLLLLSTKIVDRKLSTVIDKTKINNINTIITESGGDFTQRPEAMILSDARNLDDIGAAGIFNEFRRHVIAGKGVSGVLESWKKKVDYRYWQSLLKRSFRFEAVRKLAEQRLSVAEHFMNQLRVENVADDMQELSVNPALV